MFVIVYCVLLCVDGVLWNFVCGRFYLFVERAARGERRRVDEVCVFLLLNVFGCVEC